MNNDAEHTSSPGAAALCGGVSCAPSMMSPYMLSLHDEILEIVRQTCSRRGRARDSEHAGRVLNLVRRVTDSTCSEAKRSRKHIDEHMKQLETKIDARITAIERRIDAKLDRLLDGAKP